MIDCVKFPIIIVASPRTGSTVLAKYLKSKYDNLTLFDEPYQQYKNEFLNFSKTRSDYILKFHPGLDEYPKELFADATLIRISRKNLIEQISSWYVAQMRGFYSYDKLDILKLEEFANTSVVIDINILKKAVRTQKQYNNALTDLNLNYDYDLYYEDLPNLTNSIITPKPTNYEYIQKLVEQHI
jgi:hypothetical protein